jgi:hypothetical protein
MMENDLRQVISAVLQRIEGRFVCVLNDRTEEFDSVEAFMNSDFEKSCELSSIRAEDGKVVLELKQMPSIKELNEQFVKEHVERFGVEPDWFEGC